MTFTAPVWLLLLLLLPLFAWIGFPVGFVPTGWRTGGTKPPGWPSTGSSRKRETFSLVLRLLIVTSLILALAGMEIVRKGDELAVVFLVDVSDSMPDTAVAAEMSYLQEALAAMGPDDQSAVVLFGADALVERPMQPGQELGLVTSAPITNQTDLAEAIRLGLALFPSGAGRRMVILSDGRQTTGNAQAAAEFAAASGVQIVSVPFLNQPENETLVTAVEAPTHLRPGEQFDLNVSIQASDSVQATLRVLAGDQIVYEQPHELRRGQQTFSLPLTAGDPGFVSYQVQIAPQQDSFYQNNRLDAFSQVEGPPHILMAAPEPGGNPPGGQVRPDEYSALRRAFEAAGFTVDLVSPAHLPSDLPSLAQYNATVLVDVPARELSQRQMETIQSYVRDLGGGLVAVGGPTSYGVGGYYGTPLEAALPVDMQIKDEQRRPTLAMVFIIDHSGSMSETSGGVDKLELAKEAAARSVELLFPTDRVGVIAFDDTASWVVPMTDLSNPGAVTSAIGSIQSGGGTDILAGLQAMAKVLPGDPAKVKHVVLLTDGGADPTGIPELVERLNTDDNITLSTVGVGNDAAPFLSDLADLGGGRYHFTNDAGSIPSIFTEETALATRAYIVEEPFYPTLVNSSPILSGIQSLPPLYGYVASSPKDLARLVLESPKGDPVLATWQYGLGRAVAFTSDATGRWGQDWVRSNQFASFWAQAMRYALNESPETALEMEVALEGEQARLTIDVRSRTGDFLNGYQTQANVVAPDGQSQVVTLRQVAPGRYEGLFTPQEQGVYLIRLTGQNDSGGSFAETTGWTLSYSPEYRRIESDPDLLLRLATLTGGKVASADPAEAFTHDLKTARASRPIWPWLVALAALLLPLDVAARRLIVTRRDLVRLWDWLVEKVVGPQTPQPAAEPSSPRMESLLQAKQRVHSETPSSPATLVDKSPPAAADSDSQPKPTDQEKPDPKKEKPPAETPASTTANLLARKKSLRDKHK